MQPVSARWWPTYQSSNIHTVSFANVFAGVGGQQIAGPLQVTAGQVVVDQNNVIRRTCSQVKMVDYTGGVVTPSDPSEPLFPDGAEAQIWHGLVYPDGTQEVKSLGVFLLEEVDAWSGQQAGSTEIWISGADHGARIARAGLTQPYQTDGTSTLDVQVKALLTAALPGVPFVYNFAPSTHVPAQALLNIGDDPWAQACTLVASGGYELFPDPLGVITLRPVQDPSAKQSVASYIEGQGSWFFQAKKILKNTAVPNWVIVISQGSNIATPIRADWQDTDPRSYTYIGSPPGSGTYPLTVQKVQTSLATTQPQAQAMANAIGLAAKGLFDGAYLMIPTNAALDADDVLTVTRGAAGIVGPRRYVFDSWSYQLDPNMTTQMYGTARRVYS